MPRKRTREQRNYDFASIQIACMVELAHQVHPDVGFCASPNEVDVLIGNIQIIGDWLDQLAGYAAARCAAEVAWTMSHMQRERRLQPAPSESSWNYNGKH
jgi:hypothetical protein